MVCALASDKVERDGKLRGKIINPRLRLLSLTPHLTTQPSICSSFGRGLARTLAVNVDEKIRIRPSPYPRSSASTGVVVQLLRFFVCNPFRYMLPYGMAEQLSPRFIRSVVEFHFDCSTHIVFRSGSLMQFAP